MNPFVRRRLPPSVRSLLTDIAPKEEWTDIEPDAVNRDGILLPSRGSASAQEEFLTPVRTQEEKAAADGGSTRRSGVCMLCESKPACYTCPRCNTQYCGLACYKSQQHSVCSEEFYKESVLQELKEMGKTEHEGRKKMQEILLALRQKAERTHGGMETLLKEAGVLSGDTDKEKGEATEKVQGLELLSQLAELQQSGEGSEVEIEAVLEKLETLGGEDPLPEGAYDEDPINSEQEQYLADRVSGLNIEKLSEEELWELLSSKEKEAFMGLMKDGAIGKLVPLWRPWWEEHEEGGRSLVEVLEEEVGKQSKEHPATVEQQHSGKNVQEVIQYQGKTAANVRKIKGEKRKDVKNSMERSPDQRIPTISSKIPKLSSLCANPSPLVCYSLVNALFGYTFTVSLLNNDTDSLMFEFCDMTLVLSEALNSNRVFNSLQEALDRGETLILDSGCFDKDDPLAPARALESTAHIMTGRSRKDASGYCLAALSQLRAVFSKARTSLSKEGEDGAKRQSYFLAAKKCEFFQAWVLDNEHRIRSLAIELWNEHSRRESVKSSLEKAKTVVKQNLKKQKSTEKKGLIEELR